MWAAACAARQSILEHLQHPVPIAGAVGDPCGPMACDIGSIHVSISRISAATFSEVSTVHEGDSADSVSRLANRSNGWRMGRTRQYHRGEKSVRSRCAFGVDNLAPRWSPRLQMIQGPSDEAGDGVKNARPTAEPHVGVAPVPHTSGTDVNSPPSSDFPRKTYREEGPAYPGDTSAYPEDTSAYPEDTPSYREERPVYRNETSACRSETSSCPHDTTASPIERRSYRRDTPATPHNSKQQENRTWKTE